MILFKACCIQIYLCDLWNSLRWSKWNEQAFRVNEHFFRVKNSHIYKSISVVTRNVFITALSPASMLLMTPALFIDLKPRRTLNSWYVDIRTSQTVDHALQHPSLFTAKTVFVYNTLHNNPSYSRIPIGSRLWSIRGQTHRWRQRSIQVFFNFEFEPITMLC